MLETKYEWQRVANQDADLVNNIQEQCQINAALANLLVARGFQSVHEVQLFLKPQL